MFFDKMNYFSLKGVHDGEKVLLSLFDTVQMKRHLSHL